MVRFYAFMGVAIPETTISASPSPGTYSWGAAETRNRSLEPSGLQTCLFEGAGLVG
jgi:hypothetical protein